MQAARHCGLDFGTSNSTLALARGNQRSILMPLEGDKPTIPSTIFFDFDSDETLFGRAAVASYISGADGRMMRSLKSILGSSLADEATRVKRRVITLLEVIGMFGATIKARAESTAHETLEHVVVGRPVPFVRPAFAMLSRGVSLDWESPDAPSDDDKRAHEYARSLLGDMEGGVDQLMETIASYVPVLGCGWRGGGERVCLREGRATTSPVGRSG